MKKLLEYKVTIRIKLEVKEEQDEVEILHIPFEIIGEDIITQTSYRKEWKVVAKKGKDIKWVKQVMKIKERTRRKLLDKLYYELKHNIEW